MHAGTASRLLPEPLLPLCLLLLSQHVCRAIGEYAATEDLSQSQAEGLVDSVFRRLQELDYVFFSAAKRGTQPDLSQAEAKLKDASDAINRYTVCSSI